MPNMPRKEKADPRKYAGKAYLTYKEAMDYLGIRRSTLYNYITEMNLQPHKFKRDRRRYLAKEDVQKIEQAIASPWLLEQSLEVGQPETGKDAA